MPQTIVSKQPWQWHVLQLGMHDEIFHFEIFKKIMEILK